MYPEYYEFIKTPMDLSTLKKKLSEYNSLEEALSDLNLIWENCMNFNQEGSEIYTTAATLAEETATLIEVRN
jgi:hypothetical protein